MLLGIDPLVGDDVLVLVEIPIHSRAKETNRNHSSVFAVGERVLLEDELLEPLVGGDQVLRTCGLNEGPELIDNLIGAIWVFRNLRVEPDEAILDHGFDHDVGMATWEVFGGYVSPAKVGKRLNAHLLDGVVLVKHLRVLTPGS